MTNWTRSWTVTAAGVLALVAIPVQFLTIQPRGLPTPTSVPARATSVGEWLRQRRRRRRTLRSAARLLRPDALRPTAAPERRRMCQLQRQMVDATGAIEPTEAPTLQSQGSPLFGVSNDVGSGVCGEVHFDEEMTQ